MYPAQVSSSFPAGRILSDTKDSGDHPENDASWLLQRGGGDDRRQKGSKKEHFENEWLMVRDDSSSSYRDKEQRWCERWRPQGAAEGLLLLLFVLRLVEEVATSFSAGGTGHSWFCWSTT